MLEVHELRLNPWKCFLGISPRVSTSTRFNGGLGPKLLRTERPLPLSLASAAASKSWSLSSCLSYVSPHHQVPKERGNRCRASSSSPSTALRLLCQPVIRLIDFMDWISSSMCCSGWKRKSFVTAGKTWPVMNTRFNS